MKKTLLSFAFIISAILSFGQAQVDIVDDFQVITMNQDTFNLAEFWTENPNKKVALEFFFADSPLCREISPMISEAYQKFGCNEHDVFFISINVSDDSATVAHYQDTLNIQTPMVMSSMGGAHLDSICSIHAYPTLVLLQKDTYTPENDTIWTDEENGEIDTVYVYEETNFLEKDIWPITDSDSLVNILLNHGLNEYDCSGNDNNSPSAIAEYENFSHLFNVYPNPNSGQFYLISNEIEGNMEISILDLQGRSLFNHSYEMTKKAPLNIQNTDLYRGVYILRITNKNRSWSEKLIIQ